MTDFALHWSEEKNSILKQTRNISFDEIATAIREGDVLEVIPNSSKNHQDQDCFVVSLKGYVYVVHYVEKEKKFFLKTIYPSRKYKKLLLKK